MEALGPASLLRLELETGRTHQIRVHLAHLGHPVLGDPIYGRSRRIMPKILSAKTAIESFPRQALHAYRLAFRHPVAGTSLSFEAPLPPDMNGLIETLRKSQEKTD
jgi:23S rRNA pseudouridine1911/1915/1917 synthase